MLEISVKDELSHQLEWVKDGFKNRAYLKTLGADVLLWIKSNFDAQGIEKAWAPLSPNTLVTRTKGGSILVRLKNKYGYQLEGGDAVTVGGIDKRLLWHNDGTGVAAGRGKYAIKPKNAKALRFAMYNSGVIKKGGWGSMKGASNYVFSKGVMHPGVPTRRMLPTVEMGRKLAITSLNAYLSTLFKGR